MFFQGTVCLNPHQAVLLLSGRSAALFRSARRPYYGRSARFGTAEEPKTTSSLTWSCRRTAVSAADDKRRTRVDAASICERRRRFPIHLLDEIQYKP